MALRKTISFLIVVLLMLALVPETSASSFPALDLAYGVEISVEDVEKREDPTYGRISPEYDSNGKFTYFDFHVTATKATSGTRYRTPQMWIKIGNYPRFYFDTAALSNWQPQGDGAGQAVRVKIDDILDYIIRSDPSINDKNEASAVLFSNDKISIGFKVETYNASTGATIGGPVEEKAAAMNLLQNSGFSAQHIQDVGKYFQDLPLLIPRVTASYYLVEEHAGSWGIEYQDKKYTWLKNITHDFRQAPGFGHSVTMDYIPSGKENLFSGYTFLCSGVTYPPDQTTVKITGETSRTDTPTREQPGINIRFYFIKEDLPDFAVTELDPGTEETEPGEKYTGTVVYQLKDTVKEPVKADITLTHNSYPIINKTEIIFQPGIPQEYTFNWSGQESDSTIRAEIWPTEPANLEKEQRDAYPDDNIMEIKVPRAGFKLTMLVSGNGKTEPPEGEHIYPAGERIELSATPDQGWKFVRWEGDASGTDPNTHIVMDRDKKVRAVFERVSHTLTIRANPNIGGTTNPAPGVHKYKHGETVNIKATANQDWKFVRWTGNASGTNPSTNVLMDRDKVVIAQFEQDFPAPMDPGDPKGIGEPILQPKP